MDKEQVKIEENEQVETEEVISKEICPICGSDAIIINGHCKTCYSCGYSLCSM